MPRGKSVESRFDQIEYDSKWGPDEKMKYIIHWLNYPSEPYSDTPIGA